MVVLAETTELAITFRIVSLATVMKGLPDKLVKVSFSIVIVEGNGYEARKTSKEKIKRPNFMLVRWLNYVIATFLLVSCLETRNHAPIFNF